MPDMDVKDFVGKMHPKMYGLWMDKEMFSSLFIMPFIKLRLSSIVVQSAPVGLMVKNAKKI